jgi:septal ring factor EnvC (AmiA/AmiB activator)
MKRKIFVFTGIFIMALFCSGCLVSEDKYIKKSAEAENLTKELAAQKEKNKELSDENATLKESTTKLEKKSKEVEATSNTYKDLLQEMKGEIAKGQAYHGCCG